MEIQGLTAQGRYTPNFSGIDKVAKFHSRQRIMASIRLWTPSAVFPTPSSAAASED